MIHISLFRDVLCAGLVMSSSFIAFIRFEMILDKDGCSAVDLFLVFLQISGENPKNPMCAGLKAFQMIWDDFRQKWLHAAVDLHPVLQMSFSNRKSENKRMVRCSLISGGRRRAALTWQILGV